MKLEHKTQSVKPLGGFIQRLGKYMAVAGLVIVVSVLIGMVGYHFLAGLVWIDSFHMACLILTGMGPVAEMKTDAAKIFSSLYALYSGVVFLSLTAIVFTPIIHRLLHIMHVEK